MTCYFKGIAVFNQLEEILWYNFTCISVHCSSWYDRSVLCEPYLWDKKPSKTKWNTKNNLIFRWKFMVHNCRAWGVSITSCTIRDLRDLLHQEPLNRRCPSMHLWLIKFHLFHFSIKFFWGWLAGVWLEASWPKALLNRMFESITQMTVIIIPTNNV